MSNDSNAVWRTYNNTDTCKIDSESPRSNVCACASCPAKNRRTSTDDDDSTSLPMVVDCSDTSLVGILHNFHCEHCCLLCFLALVLDCDNNSCKDI